MKLFTIGFTQKSAEEFFTALQRAGVKRIIDIRLNNLSQLAGFAKKHDLAYFLKKIGDIDYMHRPDLAPTQEMLNAYKKKNTSWDVFEKAFLHLTERRRIEEKMDAAQLDKGCLLCSEADPAHCHRRLVGEYLQKKIENLELCHL